MNESRDRLETQNRLNEWSKKVNLLWTQDAQRVVNLLDQGFDSVIVDGPWGSGKSMNLVPQIEQEVSRRGWYCAGLDARKISGVHRKKPAERKATFEYELNRFPAVDSPSTGLMLLDESGILETEDVLGEFLAESDKRGYKRSVVIPAGGTEDVRAEMIDTVQKSLGDQGKSSAVYKLGRRTLPEELVREYFDITETPPEVVDFVLSIFPMYPNVVYFIGGQKSVDSVRRWWRDNRTNFARYQRGLNREDVELVDRRLGQGD